MKSSVYYFMLLRKYCFNFKKYNMFFCFKVQLCHSHLGGNICSLCSLSVV